jgi:hypothetical protein
LEFVAVNYNFDPYKSETIIEEGGEIIVYSL